MSQVKDEVGITKLSTKGQLVIPEGIRDGLKLKKGDYFVVRKRPSMKTGWVIELTLLQLNSEEGICKVKVNKQTGEKSQ